MWTQPSNAQLLQHRSQLGNAIFFASSLDGMFAKTWDTSPAPRPMVNEFQRAKKQEFCSIYESSIYHLWLPWWGSSKESVHTDVTESAIAWSSFSFLFSKEEKTK